MRAIAIALLLSAAAASPQTTTPPRVISRTEPVYSEEARRAGVVSSVVLSLIVDPSGIPQSITVRRGAGFGLDEAAVQAVKSWRFAPGVRNGSPVSVQTSIEMNFRLLLEGHEGQIARLEMNRRDGQGPELLHGQIPANPVGPPVESRLRIALTIGTDGVPRDLSVLESTPPEWAATALPEILQWRFTSPGAVGIPAAFEVTRTPAGNGASGRVSGRRLVMILPGDRTDSSLPAPLLLSPAQGEVFDAFPRRTNFRWEPVPGAASYLLETDYSSNGVWNTEAQQTPGSAYEAQSTDFSFDFVGAQPGRWRVWPVNTLGERGATPSEWRTFRYTR